MVPRYHSIHRHRGLNDLQLIRFAEVLGDLAQIILATFSIPLLFGGASVFLAFVGLCLAILLWYASIFLLRS